MVFDIDANGILNVSATDKATGKQQTIVIKASSGLSDEEVEQMIADAEAHAEDDHKAVELATADLGDEADAADKSAAEEAIKALEEVLAENGSDKEAIEAATAALMTAAQALAEKLYAREAENAAGDAPEAGGANAGGGDDLEGDVVDAEFEEVNAEKEEK